MHRRMHMCLCASQILKVHAKHAHAGLIFIIDLFANILANVHHCFVFVLYYCERTCMHALPRVIWAMLLHLQVSACMKSRFYFDNLRICGVHVFPCCIVHKESFKCFCRVHRHIDTQCIAPMRTKLIILYLCLH